MENPRETNHQGFWNRFWQKFVAGTLILCWASAMMLAGYATVRAHENGMPFWMSEPKYTQIGKDSVHCCGPDDCEPTELSGAVIRETEDGFWVSDKRAFMEPGKPKFFSKSKDFNHGLYFTEDADNRAFVCVSGGKIVCLAVPRQPKM